MSLSGGRKRTREQLLTEEELDAAVDSLNQEAQLFRKKTDQFFGSYEDVKAKEATRIRIC